MPPPSTDGAALRTFLEAVPDGTANNPSIVLLQAGAIYTTSQQLTLTARAHLYIDGQGATISSTNTSANRNVFNLVGGRDLRIDNVTLEGVTSGTVENGHAVNIGGVQGFGSDNVTVTAVRDDGFRVAMNTSVGARPPSRNVEITNCVTQQTQRHALSIVGAELVTIRGCTFDKTGTSAGTLIDIEPLGGDHVDDVLITRNTFGYYPPSSARRSVQINGGPGSFTTNVTVTNNVMRTLGIVANNNTGSVERSANVIFANNVGDPAITITDPVALLTRVDGVEAAGNTAHLGPGTPWIATTDCTGVNAHDNLST
jgi:hypothetical protein